MKKAGAGGLRTRNTRTKLSIDVEKKEIENGGRKKNRETQREGMGRGMERKYRTILDERSGYRDERTMCALDDYVSGGGSDEAKGTSTLGGMDGDPNALVAADRLEKTETLLTAV